jgi:acyl-CoA oxidase
MTRSELHGLTLDINVGMTMLELRETDYLAPLRALTREVNGVAVAVPPAARLNPRDLLYPLSPDQQRFRDQVKLALQDPLFTFQPGLTAEAQAKLSYERFRFLRWRLDLRVADAKDNPLRLMTVFDVVGTVDGTLFTLMSIHYCLCAGSILRHAAGVPELEPYLDELDRLESFGTFLATELGYGNNVVSLQTRADYDPGRDEVVLSSPGLAGVKFMPNTGLAGVPKLGVVMARLFVHGCDEGVFPVLVRLSDGHGPRPGVTIRTIGDKPGYYLDNAVTTLDQVRVPRACVLLGEGSELSPRGFSSRVFSKRERFLHALEQVQLGRLGLSTATASLIGASAFIAIKYAEQRLTFAPGRKDVPLMEYGNHQRDVLSALAYAYASRLLVNAAFDECMGSTDVTHDRAFRISGATKVHVTYSAQRSILACRERCGAVGLFEHNRMAAYASYCQGVITAEGDNHIVLLKIARQMLLGRDYEQPAPTARAALGNLTQLDRLSALFGTRERLLLSQLRRGMASKLRGRRSFETWNEHVTLALEVASAHATRLAFDVFAAAVGPLGVNEPVVDLAALYGLVELSPYLGFYLAEELITPDEVRGHRAQVHALCQRLRPHALALAEAFEIDNSVLRVPIASDDYMLAYWELTYGPGAPFRSLPEGASSRSNAEQASRSLPVVPGGKAS